MRHLTFLFLCTLLYCNTTYAQPGFNSTTNISPVTVTANTGLNPQSKVWTYAGKHWTVFASSAGTCIYRLDGTTWTNILTLASGMTAKADIKVVGNVTHIFVYKGTTSVLYSVEYVPSTIKYKLWTVRTARVDIVLDNGVQTATIDIDATGRMWLASDGTTDMNVRWSDAPYSTWSAPIQIATGTTNADLCAVVTLPSIGKTGIFWSNKTTKRFGFKTHNDADAPGAWSADEAPGAATALNIGGGFADNQLSLRASQNGTLYSTVKTGYATAGYPQIALLIRHSDGTWDTPYPVTLNEGTNPVAIINESVNRLKIIYTLSSGSISYKESPATAITFSPPFTLINGLYDNASSPKAPYNSEVVILASNGTTAVGVLGVDNNTTPDQTPPTVVSINRQSPAVNPTNATSVSFRAIFSEPVTGVDASDFSLTTTGAISGVVSSITPISESVYDVTVSSISGNGTLRLDQNAANTGIIDASANAIAGGFTGGQTYTVNHSLPTLTSVGAASNNSTPSLAKPGDLVSLSFTASEPINAPVVSIATHAVTAIPGSGNTFIASYTMTNSDASGIVPFSIDFSNTVGTSGTQVTTTTDASSINFDKTTPSVVSINRQNPLVAITNANSVTFRATFLEPITGVDASDFTATVSGTATGSVSLITTISVNTYDVTVSSVSGNGTLRLNLNSTGTNIADAAGNVNDDGFTGGQTYTIQQGIPTLTSVSISSNNSSPSLARPGDIVSLSFTASMPINPPSVTMTGHSVTVTLDGGNSFTATYTMNTNDASGIVPFSIDYSSTGGIAGAQVTTTDDGSNVSFDNTVPLVISISRQSPTTDPTNATSVIFRATFSESVLGVGASDFSLTIGGGVSGAILSVAPINGAIYDVTVSPVNGSGTVRLDLNSGGTGITDAAGNATTGYTAGQTYTINQAIPTLSPVTISSNNSTSTLAKPGNIISLSFTASEPINPPVVTIATHAVTATPGSGNSFTATYTMIAGDASGVVPFSINFSNLVGTAGTQVTGTTNASSVNFDNISPTVVSINRQTPSEAITNLYTVTFRASFNEPVSGVDLSDFALTTSGTTVGTISTFSPVSENLYDITLTNVSGSGTVRLDLRSSGTSITDAAGNGIATGFTGGQSYTIQPGFNSVVRLAPIGLTQTTQDKPQAKVWSYDNKWWCVLPATGGTKIFRLDGTTWTSVLTLTTTASTSKPDCIVQGNLVHILGFKDGGTSYFYTVEYNPALSSYQLWHLRPTNTPIAFPTGSETANITVDGAGRMWVASESANTVYAWWSDAPYTTWSAPVTVGTGILDDDICAITAIPTQGKIGILWSNQSTKRFGFKTHTNGASPDTWSADEAPASQSALNVGNGFADDHMNIKAASDGTLYCSVKTSYDKKNNPQLILIVRRPAGTWDNAYTETMYPEGTQPAIMLNEAQGKLKVFYTSADAGGNIVYRESPTSAISFGAAITLITDPGILYNFVTSTHQNCNSDVVIMATNISSTPNQAVSVLASDVSSSSRAQGSLISMATKSELPQLFKTENIIQAYPNPFNSVTNVTFTLPYAADYQVTLYDGRGIKHSLLKKGWAEAGVSNSVKLDGATLASGLYFISLQSGKSTHTIKVLLQK